MGYVFEELKASSLTARLEQSHIFKERNPSLVEGKAEGMWRLNAAALVLTGESDGAAALGPSSCQQVRDGFFVYEDQGFLSTCTCSTSFKRELKINVSNISYNNNPAEMTAPVS